MKLIDMHVHTASSPDADLHASHLCQMASEAGVGTVGFVAHVDLEPSDYCFGGFSECEFLDDLALAEGLGVKVLSGLEIGEPHKYMAEAETLFTRERYDFITGALHWLGDRLILDEVPFLTSDPAKLIREYYTETLEIVENSPIDILAHMGIFRRGITRAGLQIGIEINEVKLFPELLEDIFKTMIRRGIALEINTSGLRRPEKTTYPGTDVLLMYKALGGNRITLGSDTHKEGNAFYGLTTGLALMKSCGFPSYGTFIKGNYVSCPLP